VYSQLGLAVQIVASFAPKSGVDIECDQLIIGLTALMIGMCSGVTLGQTLEARPPGGTPSNVGYACKANGVEKCRSYADNDADDC